MDVAGMHVADETVVVAEDVTGGDPGVLLPPVLDHVLDRGAHGADVDDDAGRGEDAVAGGVVEREAEFAFLLDDRRSSDLLRGLAGVDDASAQLREQLVVEDRVVLAQDEPPRPPATMPGSGG